MALQGTALNCAESSHLFEISLIFGPSPKSSFARHAHFSNEGVPCPLKGRYVFRTFIDNNPVLNIILNGVVWSQSASPAYVVVIGVHTAPALQGRPFLIFLIGLHVSRRRLCINGAN